ncbi:MAG: GNAT family N-acetyltransferase [Patescibacteria group bacterium]
MGRESPVLENAGRHHGRRKPKAVRYEAAVNPEGESHEASRRHLRVKLQPLVKAKLPDMLRAAEAIFTDPADFEKIQEHYAMSLKPKSSAKKFAQEGIARMKYWFIADVEDVDKVLGIGGLYTEVADPDTVGWIGWFGVSPDARGKGIGKSLLARLISKARKIGFKKLRLWTTSAPEEINAQALYDEFDFRLTREDDFPGNQQILYREKIL